VRVYIGLVWVVHHNSALLVKLVNGIDLFPKSNRGSAGEGNPPPKLSLNAKLQLKWETV
jgi:hypothetical protein